ncbi:MAG: ShlB/FhaC/HecB family hemolysin secretion/activation protein [Dissulfurispiraceae bacterium]
MSFNSGSRCPCGRACIWPSILFGIAIVILLALMTAICASADSGETNFEIRSFDVKGNTILPKNRVMSAVGLFIGPRKTASDVEKARDALEKLYHDSGYPAVMVNIPEQTLKDGIVKLEVIETRIGKVRVTGNRYFTMEKILHDLPAFAPGEILYLPKVQEEVGRLNRNPDFKVDPAITPGTEFGTVDAELKVEDQLPLHGYLELNDRNNHDTTELRLNAMIRYDNLWQKEHSISVQYQTSPQDTNQVEVFSFSYVLPAPWNVDHQLVFYGIWSDSNTAFGEGFSVVGKGQIFGMRYVVPLPQYKQYSHNITLGIDYKHFDQAFGFTNPATGQSTETPINYTPLSASYSASLPDEWGGVSQFSAGLNMNFRQNEMEFEYKRFMAEANYLYATAGIQRMQKLPLGMNLLVKLDGQIASEPLIANEEYSAGGMENVRGYLENEAMGDNALHATVEVSFPDQFEWLGIGKKVQMTPFIFYDMVRLTSKDPLPDQVSTVELQGTGAGMRGSATKNVEYEIDWAIALQSSAQIRRYDERVYFKVRGLF